MTIVIHHRLRQPIDEATGDYVYAGRPSKWGNPYHIGRDGTRAEVIDKFRVYWYATAQAPLREAALVELTDKVIGCWCTPDACHLDIVAAYVNSHAV